MPGICRLGDKARAEGDDHGCSRCPHTVVGPAITGSSSVMVNHKPALRLGDEGMHSTCCGPNTWRVVGAGSGIFIDGKPLVCVGDATEHCGAMGMMIEGSSDIKVSE